MNWLVPGLTSRAFGGVADTRITVGVKENERPLVKRRKKINGTAGAVGKLSLLVPPRELDTVFP